MKYQFEQSAKDELFEASKFYESRQTGLGERFRLAVEKSLERILADPESFPTAIAGTRSVRVHRFPFQIFYLIANDVIEIYAVAHHSRKPGYWSHRLPGSEG